MRSAGVIGSVGLCLLALGCSDHGAPEAVEALGEAEQAILQGTVDNGVPGGHVYLLSDTSSDEGSGILLNNEWVLTAAHVVRNSSRPGRAGEMFVDLGNNTRQASEIYLHPLWNGNGTTTNPNVVDVALVRVSPPFPGPAFTRKISQRPTSELIDTIGATRCHGYGPESIAAANGIRGRFTSPGVVQSPVMTRADFTMENYPRFVGDQHRTNFSFTAPRNALGQITFPGDSGGGCLAMSGEEFAKELFGITVQGHRPECTTNAECALPGDTCVIEPGDSTGVCVGPDYSGFEAAQSFRGFAEARLRTRSTTAHLSSPSAADRITLRTDFLGQYVVDFELEGFALLTLPTGVQDTGDLDNVAQVEVADFDGDGLEDVLWSLDGSLILTGEIGRFGALFSSRHFGGAWQPFLTQLIADVLAGTVEPTRDFPFLINSTFAFIQSTNFLGQPGAGITSLQPHGGSRELFPTEAGLVEDIPPRGFDFDGDGSEDVAAISNHRVDVTLAEPLAWVSLHQQEFAGSESANLGAIAWGDFDGSCRNAPDEPCQSELVVASPGQEVPGLDPELDSGAVHYLTFDGTERTLSRANVAAGVLDEAGPFGTALAAGDFNGDGFDDLVVAASNHPVTTGVLVISGGPDGLSADSPVEALGDYMFDSWDEGFFGYALAAGDFNCDGIEDLAISQPYYTGPFVQDIEQGAVVVVFGHDGALADASFVRLEKLGLLPGSPQFQDALGTALAAGNFDGDTLDGHACVDLAIGAEFEGKFEGPGPGPLTEAGGVYVVRGGNDWEAARDAGEQLEVQHLVQGEGGIAGERATDARFGRSLAIGRMNGDRYDDLVVGTPFSDGQSGGVHMLLGSEGGIADSGHAFFQLGEGEVPHGLYPDEAGDQDQYGEGLGTLARGLVAVGATRRDLESLHEADPAVSNAGYVNLLQLSRSLDVELARTTAAGGEEVAMVGQLSEDYFVPKPSGMGFSEFIAGPYGDLSLDFDRVTENHRFGKSITSARAPFERRLFSRPTNLGDDLNAQLIEERGGLRKLRQPTTEPAPADTACIYATQTLELRDRASLSAYGILAGTGLSLSSDATLRGNVEVAGNASARDRARIYGNIKLAGNLTLSNGATVQGSVVQQTTVPLESLTAPVVTPGNQNVTVPNDQSRSLAPGSYGQVLVRSRGKLVLGAGVYHFASLTVEDAQVQVANLGGTTTIKVGQTLELRDRARFTAENPEALRIDSSSSGTLRIGSDATFSGFLSAPSAALEVGSRSNVRTCVAVRQLTLQPDASVGGLR